MVSQEINEVVGHANRGAYSLSCCTRSRRFLRILSHVASTLFSR
jgi:hypothetical protein